jgi:hypothetical protein
MENRNSILLIILIGVVILLSWGLSKNYNNLQLTTLETNICKEDSLQNVINQLQIDFENEQDGWDNKEKRYEQVIFEYEIGLEHLKNYHTESYKEFHRIIGYKENYSHEVERDNKKRLNINKW